MLSLNFNPFPAITTDRLILRQLRDEDVNEILELRSDEKAAGLIPRATYKKAEEAAEFIRKINAAISNNESIYWGIALKDDNNHKIIGTICVWNISRQNLRAEIGFELLQSYQGQGFMNEALKSVLDYAFNNLNLHSIEGNVNPFNEASIKLMEKNNFVREAYFKEYFFYDDQFLDTAVYTLLSPAAKSNNTNS